MHPWNGVENPPPTRLLGLAAPGNGQSADPRPAEQPRNSGCHQISGITGATADNGNPMTHFAYLSVTRNCVNRGNLLIDAASRSILGLARENTVQVDAHLPMSDAALDRINDCAALVLPGATLLQPQDHPAVAAIGRVRCPILAPGVALRSVLDLPDLTVARQVGLPIGGRDPFTHRSLRRAGLRSHLVGCQTLFLGSADVWAQRSGPIVITLGLGDQSRLAACAIAVADLGETVVLAQAPGRQPERFTHPNITVEQMTGAGQALRRIAGASAVVTGRLHVLLTCIATGTPAVFLGGWYDSRYSLLEHLRIPVEPPVPRRIRRLAAQMLDGRPPSDRCFTVAQDLRSAMRRYLERVAAPLGLANAVPKTGVALALDDREEQLR